MGENLKDVRNKRLKFLELANKRVNRAIKALALVANLGNRKNYEYTDDEAKKIIKTLQAEIDEIKKTYSNGSGPGKNKFEI
jgi:hypothetical protein